MTLIELAVKLPPKSNELLLTLIRAFHASG